MCRDTMTQTQRWRTGQPGCCAGLPAGRVGVLAHRLGVAVWMACTHHPLTVAPQPRPVESTHYESKWRNIWIRDGCLPYQLPVKPPILSTPCQTPCHSINPLSNPISLSINPLSNPLSPYQPHVKTPIALSTPYQTPHRPINPYQIPHQRSTRRRARGARGATDVMNQHVPTQGIKGYSATTNTESSERCDRSRA